MQKLFLTALGLAGFSFARPSPDGSTLSIPTVSLTGFPTDYLPPWNFSGDPQKSLFVPLNPSEYHHLEQRFAWGPSPAGDFKGGQLIASIASQLDPIWKSTTDRAFIPIVRTLEARNNPFRNILHTIRPSSSTVHPEAVLTPLKVGITYCWMMRLAVKWPSWSGHIVASIYNGDEGALGTLLGWINVENKPQTGTISTPAVSGFNDSTAVMNPESEIRIITIPSQISNQELFEIPKAIRERSWLDCFVQLMLISLSFLPSASVVDNLSPTPAGTHTVILHYRSTVDPKMEANVTLYSDERKRVKFHHMVGLLQQMVVSAAARDIWDNTETGEAKPESGPALAFISFGRTWRDDRPHQVSMGKGIAFSQA